MGEKFLGIIIATHNRPDILLRLLEQLQAQTFKTRKVYVVNDSQNLILQKEIQKQYPGTRLIQGTGNWWFTKSVNQGLKVAYSEGAAYFLILNDDTYIEPHYLEIISSEYYSISSPAILGSISLSKSIPGKVVFSGAQHWNKFTLAEKHFIPYNTIVDERDLDSIYPSHILTARGTIFSRQVLESIGYLNEKLFPQYGSDTEYCLRALKNNIGVYISHRARIYDMHDLTSSSNLRLKPSVGKYLKSILNRYSPNYYLNNIRLHYLYANRVLTPFFVLYHTAIYVYKYFKYQIQ